MRIIIAGLIVGGGLLTMTIAEARQAPQPGSDPNFTGVVTSLDAKDVTAGRRNFEAGARTAWQPLKEGQRRACHGVGWPAAGRAEVVQMPISRSSG